MLRFSLMWVCVFLAAAAVAQPGGTRLVYHVQEGTGPAQRWTFYLVPGQQLVLTQEFPDGIPGQTTPFRGMLVLQLPAAGNEGLFWNPADDDYRVVLRVVPGQNTNVPDDRFQGVYRTQGTTTAGLERSYELYSGTGSGTVRVSRDAAVNFGAFSLLQSTNQWPLFAQLPAEALVTNAHWADPQHPARNLEVRLLQHDTDISGMPTVPAGFRRVTNPELQQLIQQRIQAAQQR